MTSTRHRPALLPLLGLALLAAPPLGACDSDATTAADAATATDTASTDTATDAATGNDTASTDTATDAATDTATGTDAAADAGPDAATACDREGFTAVAQDAGPFYEAFFYIGQSTLGTPVDALTFELTGDAKAAGDYDLTGSHYPDCAACVLIHTGCDENLANCTGTYLATEGLLSITAFGASGEPFTGTLTGARLQEVTLDAASNSTVVPNGQTWCLDDYAFEATVQ